MTYAHVIADSIHQGVRLTTMEVKLHRFVLAELNTHRMFSRNSASSRAIPIAKNLDRFNTDPAYPVVWGSEMPGMQSGPELTGDQLDKAVKLWDELRMLNGDAIQAYLEETEDDELRLHKSLLNRWLEAGLYQTCIISSTEWENFFNQRSRHRTELAQPELGLAADLMLAALEQSEPTELERFDWHLPYIREEDWTWAETFGETGAIQALLELSVARCARVSYLTHDGVRDPLVDRELFKKLISARPMHASPLEHVATPFPANSHTTQLAWPGLKLNDRPRLLKHNGPRIGNFMGWLQLRAIVEAERAI